MNQLQADRFAEWYHFIKDKVSEKHFDMATFCSGNPLDLFERKASCGTTGCLAGYLPVIFEEFCYPNINSERPCLITSLSAEQIISKNSKKVIYSYYDEDDDEDDDNNLEMQIADFFGLTFDETYALVHTDDDNDSKEDMLYKMWRLADKYGCEIR